MAMKRGRLYAISRTTNGVNYTEKREWLAACLLRRGHPWRSIEVTMSGLGFRIVHIGLSYLASTEFHNVRFSIQSQPGIRTLESLHLPKRSIDDSEMKGDGALT